MHVESIMDEHQQDMANIIKTATMNSADYATEAANTPESVEEKTASVQEWVHAKLNSAQAAEAEAAAQSKHGASSLEVKRGLWFRQGEHSAIAGYACSRLVTATALLTVKAPAAVTVSLHHVTVSLSLSVLLFTVLVSLTTEVQLPLCC